MTVVGFRIERCRDARLAQALSRIGGETFAETFGHMYKPEDLKLFLDEKHSAAVYQKLLLNPAYGIWTANDDKGAPAAYLVAGPCDLPVPDMPENSGEVIRFYAYEEYRGSGLGGRMLKIALNWLGDRYDHIYLSVYAENFKAQNLYERFGFEKIAKYFYMVGNQADPEFIMKRT